MEFTEFNFAGNRVCVRSDDPKVISASGFLYGFHFENTNTNANQAPVLDVYHVDGGYRLILAGESEPSVISSESLYAVLSQMILYKLVENDTNHLMLHAAALERGKHGIILLAPSGFGKTTLTSWLLGHGYRYLTDELIAVDDNNKMLGLSRPLNIKASGLALVSGFPWLEMDLAQSISSQNVTFVSRTDAILKSCKVDVLIFPRFIQDAEFHVELLSVGQSAAFLMGGLLNARNLPKHGLSQVTRLARHTPSFAVQYGSLPDFSNWLDGRLDGVDQEY